MERKYQYQFPNDMLCWVPFSARLLCLPFPMLSLSMLSFSHYAPSNTHFPASFLVYTKYDLYRDKM